MESPPLPMHICNWTGTDSSVMCLKQCCDFLRTTNTESKCFALVFIFCGFHISRMLSSYAGYDFGFSFGFVEVTRRFQVKLEATSKFAFRSLSKSNSSAIRPLVRPSIRYVGCYKARTDSFIPSMRFLNCAFLFFGDAPETLMSSLELLTQLPEM